MGGGSSRELTRGAVLAAVMGASLALQLFVKSSIVRAIEIIEKSVMGRTLGQRLYVPISMERSDVSSVIANYWQLYGTSVVTRRHNCSVPVRVWPY